MAFTRFITPVLVLATGASCAIASHLKADLHAPDPRVFAAFTDELQTENTKHYTFNGTIPWYAYAMDVDVGTPAQTQSMALTVQHGESWVLWNEHCVHSTNPNRTRYERNCSSGAFDDAKSTTFDYAEDDDYFGTYGSRYDGDADGYAMQDTVKVGDAQWDNASLAIATYAMLDSGFFGLGRPWLYPNGKVAEGKKPRVTMLDQMVEHAIINSPAFSIYANNEPVDASKGRQVAGQILFGAVDKSKYDGPLKRIQASAGRDDFSKKDDRKPGYIANVSAIWKQAEGGEEKSIPTGSDTLYAAIDPSFAFSNLPTSIAEQIYLMIEHVYYWSYINLKAVQCDAINSINGSFTLELGGEGGYRLEVQLKDLIVPPEVWNMEMVEPWEGKPVKYCLLGVQADANKNSYFKYDYQSLATNWIIGSMMLKNTYAVFDSENMEVSLAPLKSKPDGNEDIVAFEKVGAHAPDSEFVGIEACYVESCREKKKDDKDNGGMRVNMHAGLLAVSTVAAMAFVLLA